MKKIAILGAGTVGGSCAQILLRDAAVLEKNAAKRWSWPMSSICATCRTRPSTTRW